MKVLAIDSSGLTAAAAIVEDEQTVAEYTINYKKTHSQTLLPMIDEMARMVEIDLSTIDAIAVAGGPGSFTGLRIGSATAKGLGLALGKPLVHVPTVDAMATVSTDARISFAPLWTRGAARSIQGFIHSCRRQRQKIPMKCDIGSKLSAFRWQCQWKN